MEKIEIPLESIQPFYPVKNQDSPETESTQRLIDQLGLKPHPEGGYYVETDRNSLRISNPFSPSATGLEAGSDRTRSASSTIFYFLTPRSSVGAFHRNKGRTVHTWHQGRGCYVIIHPKLGPGESHRNESGLGGYYLETFIVGPNIGRGEKIQWVVDGGKYKASFLLPDSESGASDRDRHNLHLNRQSDSEEVECPYHKTSSSGGLLISEVYTLTVDPWVYE